MHETQQDLPAGSWRVVEAMANTGASTYAEQVLWALGRVMAQLPDSLHSQTHKRHAVFEWAMKAGSELEELLTT